MDKNIKINLLIKQFNESNVLAHNSNYVASDPDYNFKILDNAYAHTGKMYAKVKMAIEANKCNDPLCIKEIEILNCHPDILRLSKNHRRQNILVLHLKMFR